METLAEIYEKALNATGDERVEYFRQLFYAADDASVTLIYAPAAPAAHLGLAFANLAHNYASALMGISLLRIRFTTGTLCRHDGTPFSVAEVHDLQAARDRILVENGQGLVELLVTAAELLATAALRRFQRDPMPPDPIEDLTKIPEDTWTPPTPTDDGSPREPPATKAEVDQDCINSGLV